MNSPTTFIATMTRKKVDHGGRLRTVRCGRAWTDSPTTRPHAGLCDVLRGRRRRCACLAPSLDSPTPPSPRTDHAQSDQTKEEG